jgi:two-component system chemotaxis response regulator CheY
MAEQSKVRVLIADDETHTRQLLKAVMSSMNTEVVGEAKNGREAVEMFREQRPNIALLDINMPEKTGDEALKEIIAEFPDAFIIMLTSVADMETVERCIELGASHYIRKDTPIQEMKKMISEAWGEYKKARRSPS